MTLASFETPTDHLFDAAIHGRKDIIRGVRSLSFCVVLWCV